MSEQLAVTDRTRIKRMGQRANYERTVINAVLDEIPFATIAFFDGINVHAIPTASWRKDEYLYIHGSQGSRLLNFLKTGAQVCISVTSLQGFVLARSALKHSLNYSSVCIYGCFEVVPEHTKSLHMQNFMEQWLTGRWQYVRQPDANELASITIMRISIVEAVLKSRQGPPEDKTTDLEQQVWAGVIPLQLQKQTPQQVVEQNNSAFPGLPNVKLEK